jgi:Cu/Ag efflux pump CusA
MLSLRKALAQAGGKPGSELESPMAIAILGGLITATFLNLAVVPALFSKWGRTRNRLVTEPISTEKA